MATYVTNEPTIADVMTVETNTSVINPLVNASVILQDAPVMETNKDDHNITTSVVKMPNGTWKAYNQRVKNSKGKEHTFKDTTAKLVDYLKVETDIIDSMNKEKSAEYLVRQGNTFKEGLGQTLAESILYSDAKINPEQPLGIAPRYSLKSDPLTGGQIIDMGGTSNLTSIYLIGWAKDKVGLIYPQYAEGVILKEGELQKEKDINDDGIMEWYTRKYQAHIGVAVPDTRYVVRIANIDSEKFGKSGSPDLLTALDNASDLLHSTTGCNPVFYMHKKTMSELRTQVKKATNVQMNTMEIANVKVPSWNEIPIRKEDNILLAEEQVV